MRSFKLYLIPAMLLFLSPANMVTAQGGLAVDGSGGEFGGLLITILAFSNNVLVPFILGIGFLFFVWGMFQFFIAGGANEESKEKGKSLMIYAIIAFVMVIILWGVINLLVQTTGLEGDSLGNPGVNNVVI